MNPVQVMLGARRFQNDWRETLERVIEHSSPEDKFKFRQADQEHPFAALCGYGLPVVANFLDVTIPEEATTANAIVHFTYHVLDTEIDENGHGVQEGRTLWHNFDDFWTQGKPLMGLGPFREELKKRYNPQDWSSLISTIRQVNETLRGEKEEQVPIERREIVGYSYADLYTTMLESFSEKSLPSEVWNGLRHFSAASALLDDLADYPQDKARGATSPLTTSETPLKSAREVLSRVNSHFNHARDLLPKSKQLEYAIGITKAFYAYKFVQKGVQAALDPVIFTQWRVGEGGKPIKIYKFRSMYDTPQGPPDMREDGFREPVDYARVTPIGRFMRRHWIDELPQLWNVLKGDLALTGVRAMPQEELLERPVDLQALYASRRPGLADATLTYMLDEGLDRFEAERRVLKNGSNSMKYVARIAKGKLTGEIAGL